MSTFHPVTLGLHDAEIMVRRVQGENSLRIAMDLECSESVVCNRVSVITGLPRIRGSRPHAVTIGVHDEALLVSGQTVAMLAAALGCDRTTVRNRLQVLRDGA